MLIIGLTGGISSGKSTVAKLFRELGIEIIDADTIARDVVAPNSKALKLIEAHFGKDLIMADGNLNRKLLRQKIFDNPTAKKWIEKLLHPLIFAEIQQQAKQAKSPYCIAVIPLLLETQKMHLVNRILVVDAPAEQQVERTMKRDNCSWSHVLKIMSTQVSKQARLEKANDVIQNVGALEDLKPQVLALHEKYLQLLDSSST